MFEVRYVKNNYEFAKVISIRIAVFVMEQNCSLEHEVDGHENDAKHVIALIDGKPAGCGRIIGTQGKTKLERLAVLREYRGEGVGRKIMEFMISQCKGKEVFIHAQAHLQGFYESLGFKAEGEAFDEY